MSTFHPIDCDSLAEMADFVDHQKKITLDHLAQELLKLLQTAPTGYSNGYNQEFSGFERLFRRFLLESGNAIQWDKIERLPDNAVLAYDTLKTPDNNEEISRMLSKLVVVKLNGGLGTSMGCTGNFVNGQKFLLQCWCRSIVSYHRLVESILSETDSLFEVIFGFA